MHAPTPADPRHSLTAADGSALDPALVARVLAAVQAQHDWLRDTLLHVVGIPSITNAEADVQDALQQHMQSIGLAVERWVATRQEMAGHLLHVGEQAVWENRPNLLGRRAGAGGEQGRSLLLNGHIDTVDPGDPAAWQHSPAGEVVGDLLYGRGSCDMKGGVVSILAALRALDAAGVRLRGDVLVSTTVGEEDGGLGALSTMLRGYRADAAIITEPTRLALVTAQAGSVVFRLTVPGRTAHGAVRDEGVSALERFIPIFLDLLAWEGERNASLTHPLYANMANKIPISVGVVRAGTWASTVPEWLIAEGRGGLLPGETLEGFMAEFVERVNAAAARDPWLATHPVQIEWFGGQFAPAEVAQDGPLPTALAHAHQQVTGALPPIEGVPYGADMRHFVLFGDIPTVLYGAGDVNVAHQDNEHVSLSALLTASSTLALFMLDWCGVADVSDDDAGTSTTS